MSPNHQPAPILQTSFTLDSNSQRSALELSAQTDPSDDRIMSDPTIPLSCEAKHREVLESGWEVRDFFLQRKTGYGGWKTILKNMSQLGLLFPIYGKNKMHVPKHIGTNWWLIYPSEKYESDWMIIPTIGENKIHVPNHQPFGNIRKNSVFPGIWLKWLKGFLDVSCKFLPLHPVRGQCATNACPILPILYHSLFGSGNWRPKPKPRIEALSA